MAVPTSNIKLSQVIAEIGISGNTKLSQCISSVGKTGVWSKLSNFAGYSSATLSVSSIFLMFLSTYNSKTVTVTSNTTWYVDEEYSWISISGASNSGNDSFTITCHANGLTIPRMGYVYVRWSGVDIRIIINQAAFTGFEPL